MEKELNKLHRKIIELLFGKMNAVEKAQKQLKNGQFLSAEQADHEIEEWLGK